MADNRLSLKCRRCGESVVIARLSVGAPFWTPSRTPMEDYAIWLEKHSGCETAYALDVELDYENNQGRAS